MRRGRAFSLLIGAALLGAIAKFNGMPPDAQASLLGAAGETARSWLQSAVAAYNGIAETSAHVETSPEVARDQPPGAEGHKAADAPAPRPAPHSADTAADAASGNPLWALPLAQLSITRERPIFSPSRRPPPPPRPAYVAPVAIQQPVKPPEPERPAVSLLGTIIGTSADDRLAVFLEAGTANVIRLRVGEDHQGWVLRLVNPRQATMVKDSDPVVLEMPAPGEPPPPGMAGTIMPAIPPSVVPTAAPLAQTAAPVPGAPAPQPGRRRQQRK